MRLIGNAAVLSAALVLSACSSKEERTTASSTTPVAELTPAPQLYQRMRFVSPAEQTVSVPLTSRTKVNRADRVTAIHQHDDSPAAAVQAAPIAALAEFSSPVLTATTVDVAPAAVVLVAQPAPPTSSEEAPWASEPMTMRRPAVVIRGGQVAQGKCDPRTDAAARGELANRPSFRMPATSGSVFSRGGRN